MGWLIDRGVSMEVIAGACAVYVVVATWIAATAFKRLRADSAV